MSIIYALVSRETTVLVEYSDPNYRGNFTQYTNLLLQKIQQPNEQKSCMTDSYGFHYKVTNGLTVLCLAELNCDRSLCFRYLADVTRLFLERFGDRWESAIAFSLNNDFEGTLKRKMFEYNTSGDDKISRIKDSLDSTKNIMVQNIETVLNRGEKLEVLVEKAEDLNDTSMTFRDSARTLKNQMFWKNVKWTLLLVFVVLVIIYIIVCVACSPTFKC